MKSLNTLSFETVRAAVRGIVWLAIAAVIGFVMYLSIWAYWFMLGGAS